jgi:hypothetical protein
MWSGKRLKTGVLGGSHRAQMSDERGGMRNRNDANGNRSSSAGHASQP